jgi:peptidylprolyl isomerase
MLSRDASARRRRAFGVLCVLSLCAASPPDQVVAVRGTDTMTAADVKALAAQQEADPAALKQLITAQMVQKSLLEQAGSEGFAQKPEVIAMLQRLHDAALEQAYLASKAELPPGYPTEADVKAAYDQARPQLMQPRTYHLVQAFIPLPAGARPGESDHIRRILNGLQLAVSRGRAGFEDAARRTPGVQVGDLGWVREDRLAPAAKEAVAGLLEGQVSIPVCNSAGCTLIKLIATRPAGPLPLDTVRDKLVQALKQEKQKQLETAYANQMLSKTPVRVDEIQLSRIELP